MTIVWVVLEKFFRLCIGVFVFSYVLRSFGVEFVTELNLAQTYTLIIQTIIWFGLDSYITKKISTNKIGIEYIYAITAIRMAIVSFVIFTYALFFQVDDKVMILLISLFFYSSQIVESFLSAKMRLAHACKINIIVLAIGLMFKVIAINMLNPVIFLLSYVVESLIYFSLISFSCKMANHTNKIRVEKEELWEIYRASFPIFFSSVVFILINKFNLLFLEVFGVGDDINGFVVLTKISDIILILPAVFCSYLYPIMAKENKGVETNISFYQVLIYIISFFVVVLFVFDELFLSLLLGDYELENNDFYFYYVTLLWPVFSLFRVVSGRVLVVLGLQSLLLSRAITCLILMVVFNIIFYIYLEMGLLGIALSTTLSFFYLSFLSDFQSKKTRPLLNCKIRSILYIFHFRSIKSAVDLMKRY